MGASREFVVGVGDYFSTDNKISETGGRVLCVWGGGEQLCPNLGLLKQK